MCVYIYIYRYICFGSLPGLVRWSGLDPGPQKTLSSFNRGGGGPGPGQIPTGQACIYMCIYMKGLSSSIHM